MYVRDRMI